MKLRYFLAETQARGKLIARYSGIFEYIEKPILCLRFRNPATFPYFYNPSTSKSLCVASAYGSYFRV